MKKLSAILLAFTLVFSSVGTTILFANDAQSVEAKGYKSGKKASTATITILIFRKTTTMQQTRQQQNKITIQRKRMIQIQLHQTKAV